MTQFITFVHYVPVSRTSPCSCLYVSLAAKQASTPCNTARMDNKETDMALLLLLPPAAQKPAARSQCHYPVKILQSSIPPAPSLDPAPRLSPATATAPGTATIPGPDHRPHVSATTLR